MINYKNVLSKILPFILALISLSILMGCGVESENPEWVRVAHEQYDFSIESLTKWDTQLYGDSGRKGNHDIRLEIQRSLTFFVPPSDPATFAITIEQRLFHEPSLSEAINWGDEKILGNSPQEEVVNLRGYEELFFQEEKSSEYCTIRRRYTHSALGGVIKEEVYLIRQADIVLIKLAVSEDYFDVFHDDFQRIVNSFETISSNN